MITKKILKMIRALEKRVEKLEKAQIYYPLTEEEYNGKIEIKVGGTD